MNPKINLIMILNNKYYYKHNSMNKKFKKFNKKLKLRKILLRNNKFMKNKKQIRKSYLKN